MEEDITFLNQCKIGTIQAAVWKALQYDVYGDLQSRDFLIQLTSDTGTIQFSVLDIEDLLSVLKTSLDCVKDHAEEEISKGVSQVLAALCGAERPHKNPSL